MTRALSELKKEVSLSTEMTGQLDECMLEMLSAGLVKYADMLKIVTEVEAELYREFDSPLDGKEGTIRQVSMKPQILPTAQLDIIENERLLANAFDERLQSELFHHLQSRWYAPLTDAGESLSVIRHTHKALLQRAAGLTMTYCPYNVSGV
jgi:DNA-binding transcriptional regulator YbjK